MKITVTPSVHQWSLQSHMCVYTRVIYPLPSIRDTGIAHTQTRDTGIANRYWKVHMINMNFRSWD